MVDAIRPNPMLQQSAVSMMIKRPLAIQQAGNVDPLSAAAYIAQRATSEGLQGFQTWCEAQGHNAFLTQGTSYTLPGEIHGTALVYYDTGGVPTWGVQQPDPFGAGQGSSITLGVAAPIQVQMTPDLVSLSPGNRMPSGQAMMVEEGAVSLFIVTPATATTPAGLIATQQAINDVLTKTLIQLKPQNQDAVSLGRLGLIDSGESSAQQQLGGTTNTADAVQPAAIRTSSRASRANYREFSPPIPWYAEQQLNAPLLVRQLSTIAAAVGLVLGVHVSLRGPQQRGLQAG